MIYWYHGMKGAMSFEQIRICSMVTFTPLPLSNVQSAKFGIKSLTVTVVDDSLSVMFCCVPLIEPLLVSQVRRLNDIELERAVQVYVGLDVSR